MQTLLPAFLLFTFTALPTLADVVILQPAPGATIQSVTISRDGAQIAASSTIGTTPHLHRYSASDASRSDLGPGGPASNPIGLSRNGISNDGQTIAFTRAIGAAGLIQKAYRWRNGTITNISDTFGIQDTSAATHMSADGNTIFGVGPDFLGQRAAWISTGGSASFFYTSPNDLLNASAPACTANGQVALWAANTTTKSYIYNNGVLTTINNGARWNAISATGSTLVGLNGVGRLFTWDYFGGGAPIDRGIVPNITAISNVSADGSLLLGTRFGIDTFIWTSGTGAITLPAFAALNGVDMSGWTSIRSADMSDDGKVFVGSGRFQGVDQFFVLTIPAPASLFPVLLLAAARRRR